MRPRWINKIRKSFSLCQVETGEYLITTVLNDIKFYWNASGVWIGDMLVIYLKSLDGPKRQETWCISHSAIII